MLDAIVRFSQVTANIAVLGSTEITAESQKLDLAQYFMEGKYKQHET